MMRKKQKEVKKQMKNRKILQTLVIAMWIFSVFGIGMTGAATEATVTVQFTLTQQLSVAVNESTINFGSLNLSMINQNSSQFNASNDGSGTIKINIRVDNAEFNGTTTTTHDLDLAASAGENTIYFRYNNGTTNVDFSTSGAYTVYGSSVAENVGIVGYFILDTPTSLSGRDYQQYSGTVRFQAASV